MPVMEESEIFGVALPQGLMVIDCGATETVGSPEAVQQHVDNVRAVMPDTDVEIDIETGQQVTFRLADGSVAPTYSLVWLATLMAICESS